MPGRVRLGIKTDQFETKTCGNRLCVCKSDHTTEGMVRCYHAICTSAECILSPYDLVPIRGKEGRHVVVVGTKVHRWHRVGKFMMEVYVTHHGFALSPLRSAMYICCIDLKSRGLACVNDLHLIAKDSILDADTIPIDWRCIYRVPVCGGGGGCEKEGRIISSNLIDAPSLLWGGGHG